MAGKRARKKGVFTGMAEQVELFAVEETPSSAAPPAPLVPSPLPTTLPTVEVEPAPPVELIYSVTDLAQRFRDHLRDHFSSIVVQGEVADFKGVHRSGHLYFALKDDSSQIRAVMWKGALNRVPFKVEGGMEVIVRGKLDFYGGSGSTQIVVEHMEPVGIGALQLKFEQLKEKLRLEGLFDLTRKRPLPAVAWRIGVVTGKSTAAFQDMQKVLRHRFPLAELYLFHAAVQGEKAPAEICAAIARANAWSPRQPKPLDVLVVGRGGGSYEDLFCFNDESVARAIVASHLPVVTGIGHEIDTTIADFVADYRAATPSHAVSSVVPEILDWQNRLEYLSERMVRRVGDLLADLAQKIDHLGVRLMNAAPHKQLSACRDLLVRLQERFQRSMLQILDSRRTRVNSLAQVLDALSPLKVLDRGYSLVRSEKGALVRQSSDLVSGEKIEIEWAQSKIKAQVL